MAQATTQKDAAEPVAPARSKKMLLLIAGLVVLIVAAAAYFFVFAPGGAEAEEAKPEPEKGKVLRMDPISINLAGGRYLKLGLGLQAAADAAHAPEGSQAQDYAISLFTGKTKEELADPAIREALKAELVAKVDEATHHEVFNVYFTEFVTQ